FSAAERERLAPHFTNLDRPVFALVDLPETVKGALFARYSRYQGTLRRLFLDEFAGDLPAGAPGWDGGEGARAAQLYERIFLGYGDDSVAQLGGTHLACEWVSNVLTKLLQRPRLGAYLEQSTRYLAYDSPMPDPPGGYRDYRDPEPGTHYVRAMDEPFRSYGRMILEEVKAVIPSFLVRVERPDRGGEWISYLESRARAGERWARRLGLEAEPADSADGPSVNLLRVEGSEEDLLAALLFESSVTSEQQIREAV